MSISIALNSITEELLIEGWVMDSHSLHLSCLSCVSDGVQLSFSFDPPFLQVYLDVCFLWLPTCILHEVQL